MSRPCEPMSDSALDSNSGRVCAIHQEEWWPCEADLARRLALYGACPQCGSAREVVKHSESGARVLSLACPSCAPVHEAVTR